MAEDTPAHIATHPLPTSVRLIVTVGPMIAGLSVTAKVYFDNK